MFSVESRRNEDFFVSGTEYS